MWRNGRYLFFELLKISLGIDPTRYLATIEPSTCNHTDFVNNVLHFLSTYHFDGINLLWRERWVTDRTPYVVVECGAIGP